MHAYCYVAYWGMCALAGAWSYSLDKDSISEEKEEKDKKSKEEKEGEKKEKKEEEKKGEVVLQMSTYRVNKNSS